MATISRAYYKRKTASGFEIVYLYSDATAIAETDTRKFVTPTEKATWNAKIGGVKVNGTALSADSNNVVNIDLSNYALANHTHDSAKYLQNRIYYTSTSYDDIYLEITSEGNAQIRSTTSSGDEDVKTISTTDHDHDSRYAVLDSNGLIPSKYIPGAYDDVLEYTEYSNLPSTGETGKLYVTTSDNKVYRWSGSTYIQVNGGLVLGTTADTAAAGDHNHDTVYAKLTHNHDSVYSKLTHNHDTVYSKLGHTHEYIQSQFDNGNGTYNVAKLELTTDANIQLIYTSGNTSANKTITRKMTTIFYGDTEPTDAVEGDIWISTAA